jgi:hypothetical protein
MRYIKSCLINHQSQLTSHYWSPSGFGTDTLNQKILALLKIEMVDWHPDILLLFLAIWASAPAGGYPRIPAL